MGTKKINIPDPANWKQSFVNVEKKIAKTVKQNKTDRVNIKKAAKEYSESTNPDINPSTIYKHTRLKKADLEGHQKIIKAYEDTPITPGRVAKLGAAYAGTAGAGYGAYSYLTSDGDVDGEYDGTK